MSGDLVAMPFHGDTIWAVQQEDRILVAVKPICEALGLDWHGQLQRIRRDTVLDSSGVIITSETAAGVRNALYLPLEMLNGWLFGIDDRRVRPELRDKVLAYKRECYAALWAHFRPQWAEAGEPEEFAEGFEAGAGAVQAPSLHPETPLWIALVREARLNAGKAAALDLWRRSPLPPLPVETPALPAAEPGPIERWRAAGDGTGPRGPGARRRPLGVVARLVPGRRCRPRQPDRLRAAPAHAGPRLRQTGRAAVDPWPAPHRPASAGDSLSASRQLTEDKERQ